MIFRRRRARILTESRLFDPVWYRAQYPDVELTGMEPVNHYLLYGHRMLRDPSPHVSTRFFKQAFALSEDQEPILWLGLGPARAVGWNIPRRRTENILAAAGEVGEGGRDELACELAERWLPPKRAHTAAVLRANRALGQGDEAGWLAEVNAYLDHYDVAPVGLGEGAQITSRLRPAGDLPPVADGPLVSVIMPAWNAEATIEASVRSILGQTWRRLELLVVDDASTDNTWALLQRLAAGDSRMRIFRNRVNVGPYVSKNIAVTQVNGAWITGHDADDWAHPQRIERQVRFCREKGAVACLAGMLRVAPDGRFVRLNPIGGNVHDGACRNAFISLMVDAHVFHGGLGFWDQVRVAGDSELLHRLEAVTKQPVPSVRVPTMFCLDNPAGLTNSPTLGHSEKGGIASARREYKTKFRKHHKTMDNLSSRYDFPALQRRFQVPCPLVDAVFTVTAAIQDHVASGLRIGHEIETDVAIVTNLRFPGGNASSTLDEIRLFREQGLKVTLVHAPVRRDIARAISDRYADLADIIVDWPRIRSLRARVLIVRHPAVVVAPPFERIADRLAADFVYVVKNNSRLRSDGTPVYDAATMVENARRIAAGHLEYCPISPAMRRELREHAAATGTVLPLSERDWNPTLDPALYFQPPKPVMAAPYRVGRHSRDGVEKWHEDRAVLLGAYPDDPQFRILMLGGAGRARDILGTLPGNWTVEPFGAMTPRDYLGQLDLFIYAPKSSLVEGFGRAAAEAMMAGVPCLVPPSFETTFGDLAFYCPPDSTRSLIAALAADDPGRLGFLTEVQQIALARYGTDALPRRFWHTGLLDAAMMEAPMADELSEKARAWRRSILDRVAATRPEQGA